MIKVKKESFSSMNNNSFLIVDEATNKSALVDCPLYNDKMKALIGDTDLQYILLTHGHFDHIIGVKSVKEKYNCQVAIASEDKEMLSSSKLSLAAFCGAEQNNVDYDIVVKDNDVIKLGESEIKVLVTPGHTKGSVCYMADDYLFTGDTLFCCSCGRTDFPSGSQAEMRDSLKRLMSLDGDYYVMPGHDRCSTLDFERKNNSCVR